MGTMKPNILKDDFSTTVYNITADNQDTANKIWHCVYKSNGIINTRIEDATRTVLYMKPEYVTGQTRSCLMLTNQCFSDFDCTFDMKTKSQNRTPTPNGWEVAWFMFNFYDDWHHYYMLIHSNGGLEIGRKDYNTQIEQQIFLVTTANTSPKFTLNKWFNIRVIKKGIHITVYVDGIKIADFDDNGTVGTDSSTGLKPKPPSSKMLHGNIGFYCEDAEVCYNNLVINQI
jgi:hypothetical protein